MAKHAKEFFSPEDQELIKKAIMDAELSTSGEIRVHIEKRCSGDILDCAAYLFEQLGMKKTSARNGVLILLSLEDHRFAIIGDSGINAVVPPDFWNGIREQMTLHFREGRFAHGLIEAITLTGQHLKKHFPFKNNDINELSDEISFGK